MANRGFICGLVAVLSTCNLFATEQTKSTGKPADASTATSRAESVATEMKPYSQAIPTTDIKLEMIPIPGGKFLMGSPEDEPDRRGDEGPLHEVAVEPFWMAKYETLWDHYDVWRLSLDEPDKPRIDAEQISTTRDAITRPSSAGVDQTFGMGHSGFPAINMTQLAAKTYCQWLSKVTGDYYRLPTEAEWEYACRAGTTTAYSWGNDPSKASDYACYYIADDPVSEGYIKCGRRKPNPWGLHDMHGNVAEWCLDQYVSNFYQTPEASSPDPLAIPNTLFPRVVRGGSWDDDVDRLRSAARAKSEPNWKVQDPQLPRSKWYHTDAYHVGFRVVRPLRRPSDQEIRSKLLFPDHYIDNSGNGAVRDRLSESP